MSQNTNSKIKAVVFDYSGVIEFFGGGSVMGIIAELLAVPIEKFREVYFKHNHLSNVGNEKWEDVFLKVTSFFDSGKEKEGEVKEILENEKSGRKINAELIALFPKIKKIGLKLGILSNNTTAIRKRLDELGITNSVDAVVISGEVGFQKPHKEIFEIMFEKLGVEAEEVVFIDDSRKSLEKATEIGFTPILFKNNEQLKAALMALGIILD